MLDFYLYKINMPDLAGDKKQKKEPVFIIISKEEIQVEMNLQI